MVQKKKAPSKNPWIEHVKAYSQKHPNKRWSECLKEARKTYKKKETKIVPKKQPVYKGRASAWCSDVDTYRNENKYKPFIIENVSKVANLGVTKAIRTLVLFDDKTIDDKTIDDKTIDDKTIDDETIDDKTDTLHLAWFDPRATQPPYGYLNVKSKNYCKGGIEVSREEAKQIMGIGDVKRVTLTKRINGKDETFTFDFSDAKGRLRKVDEKITTVKVDVTKLQSDNKEPYYFKYIMYDYLIYDSDGRYISTN